MKKLGGELLLEETVFQDRIVSARLGSGSKGAPDAHTPCMSTIPEGEVRDEGAGGREIKPGAGHLREEDRDR
jgi:hypothetical protein